MDYLLIGIDQGRPGFEDFVGSWLCKSQVNILVDVGPFNTAHKLISSLEREGVEHIDYVLLTHIHIDHAGALAPLLDRFPTAMAVCHEKGLRYLIEPSRLWEGSLQVLGDLAVMYGRPEPVEPERLIAHTDFSLKGMQVIETPGHAPHHLSFGYEGKIFSGEAAGNYLKVNGREYLRPATPPRFFFHVFMESVDRLLSLPDQSLCYAHFGEAESSHQLLKRFKEQLIRWEGIIRKEFEQGQEGLLVRCLEALLAEDPELGAFYKMETECQERERTFIMNAVKGFVGFFNEGKT